MCIVAAWDLGEGRKPGTAQLPAQVRRVGADAIVLTNHTAANSDSIVRNSGYRHKAKLLDGPVPVVVLSRHPVSAASVVSGPFGVLAMTDVHVSHGPLRLLMALFDEAFEAASAEVVAAQLLAAPRAAVLMGNLGHDVANPSLAWTTVRRDLVDLLETSGVHQKNAHTAGALGRGVEVRGAGVIEKAAGGPTDLTWVRLAL